MASFVKSGKKIVAIGRNYVQHAQELGNSVPKREPIMFLKPTSSYTTRDEVHLPRGILVHHEVELGLVMKAGKDITQENALDYVAGYALAIDYTGRNIQNEAQSKGLPWSAAKGFDDACPIGEFIPKSKIKDPHAVKIWLKVREHVSSPCLRRITQNLLTRGAEFTFQINGETKQSDSTELMIYKIPRLIEHCSSIMSFEDGDLLLTGTPAGVGPVKEGDEIEAGTSQVPNECCRLVAYSKSPTLRRPGLVQDGELVSSIKHLVRTRKGGYLFKPETK
ncbi:BZ3500_MvSof-1268-A1-R1_Chr4-2g06900 [Microbotryum saponariae]|uniref:BZ3500_MvSof-1268-A1-R1_Chr4-2g06900 protein n=1 Tax=Microbotryum saponariae TaxID=289078 RepID=A0A2X0KV87_9BASI|nr:BZ3500_MvSof-1268-A1-R1_Chr4-2g06900 [Microbotryum saponariae]SDA06565.1 BZ3501_MvSof-1269-A2-R1_Chr4-2g06611 [Microbotryum saponariae]